MAFWKGLELFAAGTLPCGEDIYAPKDPFPPGILLSRLHLPELADLYIFNAYDIIFYFILSYLIDFSPDQSQSYIFLLFSREWRASRGKISRYKT